MFQWTFTTNSDLGYGPLKSPHFTFYGSERHLCRNLERTDTNEDVQFSFRGLIPNERPVYHRTSLSDEEGKEIFTASGQLFSHTDNVLMIISYQNYFLPHIQSGRLVFRFTWFEDECLLSKTNLRLSESSDGSCELAIGCDTSQSSPTKESSTSTESSDSSRELAIQLGPTQSPPTRNSSTNTEISLFVCDRAIQTGVQPLPTPKNSTITGNSIQVSERLIQTDIIQPLTTRDSSTDTGNTIQVSERLIQTDVIQPLTTRDRSTDTETFFQICNRSIQAEIIQSTRDSSTATESSIIVHECGSQTEGIESLPSNEISTNTESSMNMLESAIQTEEIQSLNSSTGTDEEQNALLKILSDQLGCFYESQANTDCVLQVGESQFPVHRSVLSARSKVFERMFYHNTAESQTGIVNIQDIDAGVVDDVMHYIYTGKIRGLSPDTAISVYDMADKYGLIELKERCLKFIKENITMKNVFDVALMAQMHAELELGKQVILFIEMRLEDLSQTDEWLNFSENHPKLAIHLISSALFSLKNGN